MPIVDGKYVAPTWINKQAPAINATELNAISQTLEYVNDSVFCETVEYTGAGVTSKTISFSQKPDIVLIYRTGVAGEGEQVWLLSPIWGDWSGTVMCWSLTLNGAYTLTTSWSGNNLTISSTQADRAFNYSTVTYKAIGMTLGV